VHDGGREEARIQREVQADFDCEKQL